MVKYKLDTTKSLITLCPNEFARSSGSCRGENYTLCRIKRYCRSEKSRFQKLDKNFRTYWYVYGKHVYKKNLDDDTAQVWASFSTVEKCDTSIKYALQYPLWVMNLSWKFEFNQSYRLRENYLIGNLFTVFDSTKLWRCYHNSF